MATGTARWLTWRVAAFFLAACLVVGAAIAGIAWYARSTYYVQLDPPTPKGHITVFQGRPGGVLWFAPTVVKRTRYTSGSVQSSFLPALEAGVLESTLGAADGYIHNLVADEARTRRARHQSAPPSTTAPARRPGSTRATSVSSVPPGQATGSTSVARSPSTGSPSTGSPSTGSPSTTGVARSQGAVTPTT